MACSLALCRPAGDGQLQLGIVCASLQRLQMSCKPGLCCGWHLAGPTRFIAAAAVQRYRLAPFGGPAALLPQLRLDSGSSLPRTPFWRQPGCCRSNEGRFRAIFASGSSVVGSLLAPRMQLRPRVRGAQAPSAPQRASDAGAAAAAGAATAGAAAAAAGEATPSLAKAAVQGPASADGLERAIYRMLASQERLLELSERLSVACEAAVAACGEQRAGSTTGPFFVPGSPFLSLIGEFIWDVIQLPDVVQREREMLRMFGPNSVLSAITAVGRSHCVETLRMVLAMTEADPSCTDFFPLAVRASFLLNAQGGTPVHPALAAGPGFWN